MFIRVLTFILFVLLSPAIVGECQSPCSGLKNVSVNIQIYLGGKLQNENLSKKDLVENYLEIRIGSTDLKIVSFTICYDCHSGVSYDINCKDYFDNLIKPGDNFLKNVRAGDHLVFDCLVITKGGNKFTTTGVQFRIVE